MLGYLIALIAAVILVNLLGGYVYPVDHHIEPDFAPEAPHHDRGRVRRIRLKRHDPWLIEQHPFAYFVSIS